MVANLLFQHAISLTPCAQGFEDHNGKEISDREALDMFHKAWHDDGNINLDATGKTYLASGES